MQAFSGVFVKTRLRTTRKKAEAGPPTRPREGSGPSYRGSITPPSGRGNLCTTYIAAGSGLA